MEHFQYAKTTVDCFVEEYINLRVLIVSNALDMLIYMALISWLCTDDSCIKVWDLTLFCLQLLVNIGLCVWLIHHRLRGYRFLWINLFWLAFFFFVFSSLHMAI